MERVLKKVKSAYPDFAFQEGDAFSWSPKHQTITYTRKQQKTPAEWSLFHELAHALLGHSTYSTDFELLLLEVAAWEKAKELATAYKVTVDEEHIQDCLDTYRDWLYQRSSCPTCSSTSLQQNSVTYRCFHCGTSWTVTASRFCRPYRLTSKQPKTPSPAAKGVGTTFL